MVRSAEFEPMVTAEEFARAQEILGKNSGQRPHVHEYPFTGLMRCAYCNRQITGEKKRLKSGIIWENYHCSDPDSDCTKCGMSRKTVEELISKSLDSITVDPELCQIALDNIVRNLNAQADPVRNLYAQQNGTLLRIDERLGKLADMWISGMMSDEATYKTKENELTTQRDALVTEVEKCRSELDRMRANAIGSANYVSYAKQNFLTADDKHKREIAHALGTNYVFYGKEKKIALEIHPLLEELVKYTKEMAKGLEPALTGCVNKKEPGLNGSLLYGGRYGTRTCDLHNVNVAL